MFRRIILIFLISFFIGCGGAVPNFSKKGKVIKKTTDSYDISEYAIHTELNNNYSYTSRFYAPYDFASINDCIGYDQGLIKKVDCD